ncbi:metallophosphoesterase [Catellatospora tritici]|uniref:metallophosphoesterase n=1 Tax=Catellatospora tritici TaxID=2851566 RepID=UPI001C2D69FB|nr:metallophosphoesterase [Catellatospora tritici]MBV1852776.1 metallophosphoesterase [Catellatospora tritici]
MYVIAHVSDTHFDGRERSAARAAKVMAYLAALRRPADLVLVTGDITDNGLPEEYEQARETLSAVSPLVTLPGNHDDRAAFREFLLGQPPSDAPLNRTVQAGAAILALCDSTIPGRDDGVLAPETLDWLRTVLADAAGAPVLIAFHHPPAVLHEPFIDSLRQFDAQPLADLVAGYPNVIALLSGHAHTAATTVFAGRPLLIAPGVASTLRLPWEHGPQLDHEAPVGLAFHVLDDDHRITTHYRAVQP